MKANKIGCSKNEGYDKKTKVDHMTTDNFQKKFTAILSADVEGYSRLMGEDEDITVRILTAYRELMSTLIEKHRGRVVKGSGSVAT